MCRAAVPVDRTACSRAVLVPIGFVGLVVVVHDFGSPEEAGGGGVAMRGRAARVQHWVSDKDYGRYRIGHGVDVRVY